MHNLLAVQALLAQAESTAQALPQAANATAEAGADAAPAAAQQATGLTDDAVAQALAAANSTISGPQGQASEVVLPAQAPRLEVPPSPAPLPSETPSADGATAAPQASNATYGRFLNHQETAEQTTAQTEQVDLLQPGQSLMGSALSTAAYLCLILGIIFLGYWLLRRFTPHGIAMKKGGLNPKLMGRLVLGQRQHVDVVRVDKRTLVLGVTEHQITLLTELSPRPGQFFDDEDEDAFTDFAEMLGKKSAGDDSD